jgi:hypothetical protein
MISDNIQLVITGTRQTDTQALGQENRQAADAGHMMGMHFLHAAEVSV